MPSQADHEYVRRLMSDFNHQQQSQQAQIVKLPCGHSVQIDKVGDQYLKCPEPGCGKQFMYVHSRVNKRIYSE